MLHNKVMRTIFSLVTILGITTGCTSIAQTSDLLNWQDEVKDRVFGWSASVIEYNDVIYYTCSSGIQKINSSKKSEKETVISESDINLLFMYNDMLYYAKENEIFCLPIDNPKNKKLVWDKSMAEGIDEFLGIIDFSIYNNILYIKNTGTSIIQYNINQKHTQMFVEDVSSGAFYNNKFYYTDHAERTFSIFSKDLETGNITLERGEGKTYANGREFLYDQVQVVDNKIYYTTRLPNRVYEFSDEGDDKLIEDFSNKDAFIYLSGKNKLLYYAIEEELYSYDISSGEKKFVSNISRFEASKSFGVIKNTIFYYTVDSNTMQFKVI